MWQRAPCKDGVFRCCSAAFKWCGTALQDHVVVEAVCSNGVARYYEGQRDKEFCVEAVFPRSEVQHYGGPLGSERGGLQ